MTHHEGLPSETLDPAQLQLQQSSVGFLNRLLELYEHDPFTLAEAVEATPLDPVISAQEAAFAKDLATRQENAFRWLVEQEFIEISDGGKRANLTPQGILHAQQYTRALLGTILQIYFHREGDWVRHGGPPFSSSRSVCGYGIDMLVNMCHENPRPPHESDAYPYDGTSTLEDLLMRRQNRHRQHVDRKRTPEMLSLLVSQGRICQEGDIFRITE